MIETFTKDDFEAYLSAHSPYQSLGFVDGEYTYELPLDNQTSIIIRSSIKSGNLSADVGKDSIRAWLVAGDKPLGTKTKTHRQPGWEDRLTSKINQLILWRTLAGDCKECGLPKSILKAKTKANKGRPFAKCDEHNNFMWLDKPIKTNDIYFSEESNGNDNNSSDSGRMEALARNEKRKDTMRNKPCSSSQVRMDDNGDGGKRECSDLLELQESEANQPVRAVKTPNFQQKEAIEVQAKSNKIGKENDNDTGKKTFSTSVAYNGSRKGNTLQSENVNLHTSSDALPIPNVCLQKLPKKTPNQQQKEAIEADINANLRVLAGPGSGKTFVIEHRYKYLVDNGVDPDKIIVCTFGKQSANDMGKRILATCPQANVEQICTINALCYRLIAKWYPNSRWYKWQGPKDWQIKKTLEDVIGPIWQEDEKPSAQEVYRVINTSKYYSMTTDDSYVFFVNALGQTRGAWLYEIRSKFDAWLNRNRFLTFADQLFLVEQRLKNNADWRTMIQERFSHVIVDESQDTNYQAMRILITISLKPGQNTVYKSEVK